ncbi:MAG: FAD-dependent oxidoreductase [Bacteroidales bacterium]
MSTNKKHIAIIGGEIAGMEAASVLTGRGYKVTILEEQNKTGGMLNNWSELFPDFTSPDIVLDSIQIKKPNELNIIYNTRIASIKKDGRQFELSDNASLKFYADAVLLASGYQLFDAKLKEEYGYDFFDNVITSADFERIHKSGKKFTTATGKSPNRIAIIHCVGSRDAKIGNTYCSKVCCITGIKQAIEINQMLPECEVYNFYMNLRLYGFTYESMYLTAQKKHKIQFIRGRLSEISEKQNKSLQIKAEDTLQGRPLRMNVDMAVLLVGMEAHTLNADLYKGNTMELDENRFFKSKNIHTARNSSIHEGVFMAGSCICPISVNETIENARSAAVSVMNYLNTIAK